MSEIIPRLIQPLTWERLYFMVPLHPPPPKTHDRLTSIERETTHLCSWNTGTAINRKQHYCETGHLQSKILSSQKQAKVAVLRNSSKSFWSGTNGCTITQLIWNFLSKWKFNSGTKIAKMYRMLRSTTNSEVHFSYKCTYNKTAELLEIKCCRRSRY